MDFSNFSCQSLGLTNMKQINLSAIFPSPSVSKVRRFTWSFKLGDKKPWRLNQLETDSVTQTTTGVAYIHLPLTLNNKFRDAYKINAVNVKSNVHALFFFLCRQTLKVCHSARGIVTAKALSRRVTKKHVRR